MMLTRFDLLKEFNRGDTARDSFLYERVTQVAPFVLPVLEDIDRDSILDKVDRKVNKAKDTLRNLIPE
jgi:hypothetical protein